MNYRKRRARAWAGLYVGLVGADAHTDDRADSPETEGND